MKKRVGLITILMAVILVGCKPSEAKLAEAEEARLLLQQARQTAEETYLDIADTSLRSELDKLGVKVIEIEAIDFTTMSNKKIDEKLPEIAEIMKEYRDIQERLDGTFQKEQTVNAEKAKDVEISAYILNKTGFDISSIILHDLTSNYYSDNLIGEEDLLANGYTLMGVMLEINTDSSEWEFLVKDANDTQRVFSCQDLREVVEKGVAITFEYDAETDTGSVEFGGYFNN